MTVWRTEVITKIISNICIDWSLFSEKPHFSSDQNSTSLIVRKQVRLTSSWQSLNHEHVCWSLTVEVPGSEAHFISFAEIPGSKKHIPSKKRLTPQISKDEKWYRTLRELGPHID